MKNRQILIIAIITLLQSRKRNIASRIFLVCQLLIQIYQKIQEMNEENYASVVNKLTEDFLSMGGGDIFPGCFGEQETGLMRAILQTFNWGLESSAKSLQDIGEAVAIMQSGTADIWEPMAANYTKARDSYYLPFVSDHPWLEENFFVYYAYTDMFKQFSACYEKETTIADLFRHEISLLSSVFCLFRFIQCKFALQNNKMDEPLFMDAVYQIDNSYIHYPAWMNECARRMPDLLNQPQIFTMMLSC